MSIVLADALLLAGAFVAFRWARVRPWRFLPLAIATGAATAFTLVRNHYNLEDAQFLAALATTCGVAAATVTMGTLGLRQGSRRSLLYGALAVALVPVFFVAGIVVRFTACLISGCDLS